MRDELVVFAEEMGKALVANEHKGGWKDCSLEWLASEMWNHANALERNAKTLLTEAPTAPDRVLHACILDDAADIANFAMMIADITGSLPAKERNEWGLERLQRVEALLTEGVRRIRDLACRH